MLLGRFNHLRPDNLKEIQSLYPKFNIKFMSVHGSKGLGADYVILLGLDKGKFGFPCEIEDDPILGKFFDTPEKKAKWLVRIKIGYILWIAFVIIGIMALLIRHLFK